MVTHLTRMIAAAASRHLDRIGDWLEVSRQRRKLAALDDRMLKDIGVSRASAAHEARRPFWDLPEGYGERRDMRQGATAVPRGRAQALSFSISASETSKLA